MFNRGWAAPQDPLLSITDHNTNNASNLLYAEAQWFKTPKNPELAFFDLSF